MYSKDGDSAMVTDSGADAASLCLVCPAGAECPGGSDVIPHPNYWRSDPPPQASRRDEGKSWTVEVFPCPAAACKGGVDNECHGGREGPVRGLAPT